MIIVFQTLRGDPLLGHEIKLVELYIYIVSINFVT